MGTIAKSFRSPQFVMFVALTTVIVFLGTGVVEMFRVSRATAFIIGLIAATILSYAADWFTDWWEASSEIQQERDPDA